MKVLYWVRPVRDRGGTYSSRATKHHVSIDGTRTVCGTGIPAAAVVIAETADWHLHATCYNCVHRLWPAHAPAGFERPLDGADFPLRRTGEARPRDVHPGRPPAKTNALAASSTQPPTATQSTRDPNPAPDVIRRWHIANPYSHESCALCGEPLERGELINIEFEAGVMHATCSDLD